MLLIGRFGHNLQKSAEKCGEVQLNKLCGLMVGHKGASIVDACKGFTKNSRHKWVVFKGYNQCTTQLLRSCSNGEDELSSPAGGL